MRATVNIKKCKIANEITVMAQGTSSERAVFTVEVKDTDTKKSFFTCIVWGETNIREMLSNISKGDTVKIKGNLSSYTTKDGVYKVTIAVLNIFKHTTLTEYINNNSKVFNFIGYKNEF